MLTQEANDRLTRVGPGTPMGNLLRQYWHPVATASELAKEPVMPVKLLGENLALFKAPDGTMGLMSERCPHRGASMAYGIPENEGLRCPYHGWIFDTEGKCIDQPAEPADSTFKHRVRIAAYPVQEMGGLIWAYLGPAPAPLLPRYELFAREDLFRDIGITLLPCNWVQQMENSVDPIHLEYLHLRYSNYILQRQGKPPVVNAPKHAKFAFDVYEHGIRKRRLWEGESEDSEEWTTGHPVLFPNILAVIGSRWKYQHYQIRVPEDDTTTRYYWYFVRPLEDGEVAQKAEEIGTFENPYRHPNGRLIVETVNGQDMMAWVTQGPVTDRTAERLGTSDKGVILYRTLLMEAMEKVGRGEDPLAVIRDPAVNDPWIPTRSESNLAFNLRVPGMTFAVNGEFIPLEDNKR